MIFVYKSAVAAHLYGFGNRRREEGDNGCKSSAREVIILPSIILPVLLLRAGRGDHRIQTSTSLFCPFIILSSLTTSKFQDKMIGRQNDFRIPVSHSRTLSMASEIVGGLRENNGGENNGCKSSAREVIILPSIILPVLLLRAGRGDHRIQTSTSLFCPFIILSSLPTSKFQDKIIGGQNDFRSR